jgi:hypothetical protein
MSALRAQAAVPSKSAFADVSWKGEGQFQGRGVWPAKRAAGGAELIMESARKNGRLSDSRPPVRPPGEPTPTEFMMANNLR